MSDWRLWPGPLGPPKSRVFHWPCCFYDSRISNLPRPSTPSELIVLRPSPRINAICSNGGLMQELVDSQCCGSRRNPISWALIRLPTEQTCAPVLTLFPNWSLVLCVNHSATRCMPRFGVASLPDNRDKSFEVVFASSLPEEELARGKMLLRILATSKGHTLFEIVNNGSSLKSWTSLVIIRERGSRF